MAVPVGGRFLAQRLMNAYFGEPGKVGLEAGTRMLSMTLKLERLSRIDPSKVTLDDIRHAFRQTPEGTIHEKIVAARNVLSQGDIERILRYLDRQMLTLSEILQNLVKRSKKDTRRGLRAKAIGSQITSRQNPENSSPWKKYSAYFHVFHYICAARIEQRAISELWCDELTRTETLSVYAVAFLAKQEFARIGYPIESQTHRKLFDKGEAEIWLPSDGVKAPLVIESLDRLHPELLRDSEFLSLKLSLAPKVAAWFAA